MRTSLYCCVLMVLAADLASAQWGRWWSGGNRRTSNDNGLGRTQPPATTIPTRSEKQSAGGSNGECGKMDSAVNLGNRIFGGDVAQLGENPWLALLQYRHADTGRVSFQCGGVLIDKRYVLTAAHCTNRADIGRYRLISVRLGEFDTSQERDCEEDNGGECADPPRDYGIEERIQHEQYGRQQNDIALLRLDGDAPYTKYIKPICLPSKDSLKSSPGRELKVAGWGKTESGQNSEMQMQVTLPVVDKESCSRAHNRQILSTQLCAGGQEGKDSCRGDSGGPLMGSGNDNRYQVHGIVSFGPRDCGTAGKPGVYTDVAEYVDWVRSKIRS